MPLSQTETAVMDAIAAREAELIDRAVGWCAISSGSRNLQGLKTQCALLADALAGLPGEVSRIALPPTQEVGADGALRDQPHTDALRLVVRPEAPIQVALTGHYDTVYPEGTRFLAVRRREDGALQGPGVADMKGGISVMLGALEAFERAPEAERLGYTVLLSPDEEIGSPASAPLLAELGAGAHLGMTYEPALADGGLAAARKGSANWHAVVRGRAAHAGRDFASGRNALAAAARLAARLDSLNGLRDGVTLNVARIDGGGALNVVPDLAVVRFNARAPDAESARWIEAEVRAACAVAQEPDVALVLHGGFTRPPKPFNAAQAALFAAAQASAADLGQTLRWQPSGGVCEGNNLFAAGLPNIDTLGVRGGEIHSEREHAWPESFVERGQLSALILLRAARGEIDAPAIRAQMGRAA